jgi:hypothetical protein
MTLERRFSGGLSLLSAYTYSHALDDVPLQEGGGVDGPVPQDSRYPNLSYASSSFDIRHRFTQTASYDLPFGAGKRFLSGKSWMNQVVGDWQTNVIVTAQTGLPFTPVLANSTTNNGSSSLPDKVPGVSTHVAHPNISEWFNTSFNVPGAVWQTPPQYTFGDPGLRNTLRGPHRTNVDFSLFKGITLTERFRLQFRAEAFNVLNHPQFDLPAATIGQAGVGTITDVVGNPRDIQLGLRLTF